LKAGAEALYPRQVGADVSYPRPKGKAIIVYVTLIIAAIGLVENIIQMIQKWQAQGQASGEITAEQITGWSKQLNDIFATPAWQPDAAGLDKRKAAVQSAFAAADELAAAGKPAVVHKQVDLQG